jgi:hypothetical protein
MATLPGGLADLLVACEIATLCLHFASAREANPARDGCAEAALLTSIGPVAMQLPSFKPCLAVPEAQETASPSGRLVHPDVGYLMTELASRTHVRSL